MANDFCDDLWQNQPISNFQGLLMPKSKSIFICNQCGAQMSKWAGQCGDCGAWNSVVEEVITTPTHPRMQSYAGFAGENSDQLKTFNEVPLAKSPRIPTNVKEFDRVLGGGIVPGSVVLIGGDPGIGKSTLLLQTVCKLGAELENQLYVSGEESLQQIALRAKRLDLKNQTVKLLADTNVEKIIAVAAKLKPAVMIIDSIQTMFTETIQSAPGAVGQLRESAAQLVQFAKQTGIALFIVGHVTKEGAIAGPRILEHMVDTVLYFEGDRNNRYRILRAVKNRFGAVNEIGVFCDA